MLMYSIIKATLYCNTQIYRPNTPYLAQRSVDSPCSNRVEARSFHSQVGPSLETVILEENRKLTTSENALHFGMKCSKLRRFLGLCPRPPCRGVRPPPTPPSR